jgi:hypothetical protein
MIDFLTRYISTISLTIGATLSLFNIGYFWKIGLHFLGLIDFSNLVYSFGASLVALSVAGFILASVAHFATSNAKMLFIALAGAALSTWGIFHFSPRTLVPEYEANAAILVGFVLSGSAFTAKVRSQPHYVNLRNLSTLAFGWFVIAFQAGVWQASAELSDRFKYTVSTKSGVIDNVRILRASSSGFLLASEGKIIFIPQAEIKDVTSQTAN